MRSISYLLTSAACGAVVFAIAGSATAAGFYVQEQSVRGLGRAYAGEGADTGADALWWNPAAIAGVSGLQLYNGFQGALLTGDERNNGSTLTNGLTGQTTRVNNSAAEFNPTEDAVIPNFAAAWKLNSQWAIGLALTSPYSVTTTYPLDSYTRYDALKTKLLTIDVQPTVAWRPVRWLDLGLGADIEHVDSNLSSAQPNPTTGEGDGYEILKGSGWDYGWVAGAEIHPDDRLSVGGSYRSAIRHTLNGHITVQGLQGLFAGANEYEPGVAKFDTPWIATLAAHYKLTPRLTLEGQVQRFGWSRFSEIDVYSPQHAALAPASQVTPEGFRDTSNGSVGLDYAVNSKVTVRAGVQYDQTPTPSDDRSARIPDGNRWLFAGGATITPWQNMAVDVSAGYYDVQSSALNRSDSVSLVDTYKLNGVTSNDAVIMSLGLRMSF